MNFSQRFYRPFGNRWDHAVVYRYSKSGSDPTAARFLLSRYPLIQLSSDPLIPKKKSPTVTSRAFLVGRIGGPKPADYLSLDFSIKGSWFYFLRGQVIREVVYDGRGHEDGRVSTHQDTHHQSEGKTADTRTT